MKNLIVRIISKALFCKKNSDYFKNNLIFKNVSLVNTQYEAISSYVYEPSVITEDTECIIFIHGIRTNRRKFGESVFKNQVFPNSIFLIPDCREFGDSNLKFDINEVVVDLFVWMYYISMKYKIYKFQINGHSFGATISMFFYEYIKKMEFIQEMEYAKGRKLSINMYPFIYNEITCDTNIKCDFDNDPIDVLNDKNESSSIIRAKCLEKWMHFSIVEDDRLVKTKNGNYFDMEAWLKEDTKFYVRNLSLYAPFMNTDRVVENLFDCNILALIDVTLYNKMKLDTNDICRELNLYRNIYLIHGKLDTIIDLEHSRLICQRLKIPLFIREYCDHSNVYRL